MGGKRIPPKSDKFDRDAMKDNGLACPFVTGDLHGDSTTHCHREEGFRLLKDLKEHVLRKHGYTYGCTWCGTIWTGNSIKKSEADKEITTHSTECDWKKRGLKNPKAKHKEERMSQEQHKQFDAIRLSREVDLEALYQACGKFIPDCYHVKPLSQPIISSAATSSSRVLGSMTAHQTVRGGFFQGYKPPELEYPDTPLPPLTSHVTVGQFHAAQTQGNWSSEVSGTEAAQNDDDSGYGLSTSSNTTPSFLYTEGSALDEQDSFAYSNYLDMPWIDSVDDE